jgi:hypothetical protein
MPNGNELIWQGRYGEAARRLRREAPRERGDDFKIGKAQLLAVALLLGHDFDGLEEYLSGVISKAWQSVSSHQILWGLSRWFRGDHAQGVLHWEIAKKCAYCQSKGLDAALMLYFAAVRDRSAFQIPTALAQVGKALNRLAPNFYDAYTAEYVLGSLGDEEYFQKMSVWDGKYPDEWVPALQAMAQFYFGLNAFRSGRIDSFWDCMRKSATFIGKGDLFNECIIARLEISTRGTKMVS